MLRVGFKIEQLDFVIGTYCMPKVARVRGSQGCQEFASCTEKNTYNLNRIRRKCLDYASGKNVFLFTPYRKVPFKLHEVNCKSHTSMHPRITHPHSGKMEPASLLSYEGSRIAMQPTQYEAEATLQCRLVVYLPNLGESYIFILPMRKARA